jgi:hypothetical protein
LRVIEKTGNTNKGVQNLVSWQHDRKQLLQPTKAGITIAGLGAGSPEGLTIGVASKNECPCQQSYERQCQERDSKYSLIHLPNHPSKE